MSGAPRSQCTQLSLRWNGICDSSGTKDVAIKQETTMAELVLRPTQPACRGVKENQPAYTPRKTWDSSSRTRWAQAREFFAKENETAQLATRLPM